MIDSLNIQNLVLDSVKELNGLQNSIQKEFEYNLGLTNPNEITLKAKKRQLQSLVYINSILNKVFDLVLLNGDYITKLQGCLLNYGVSPEEVEFFTQNEVKHIISEVKRNYNEGLIQVPESIRPLINEQESQKRWLERLEKEIDSEILKQDKVEESKPVKYSDKPIIGLENLKKMTNNPVKI